MAYSVSSSTSLRIRIFALAGLKAFSNLSEQRSSHIRHPAQFSGYAVMAGPFLFVFVVIVTSFFAFKGSRFPVQGYGRRRIRRDSTDTESPSSSRSW
jgi:hypothetical protein